MVPVTTNQYGFLWFSYGFLWKKSSGLYPHSLFHQLPASRLGSAAPLEMDGVANAGGAKADSVEGHQTVLAA